MIPSISVVIPTYNRGPQIESTLDSVLAQTLLPLEIIVVDDGSSDQTPDWIESRYGARVRVVRQPNGGVARARNRGLREARGEFIAFLDHDDIWMPQKLELQSALMRDDPPVGVVHCDWRAVDEAGTLFPFEFQLTQQKWWHAPPREAYPWVWMPHPSSYLYNPLHSMSMPLVRTRLLHEIGGFDPALVPSDDWDLWIRLSRVTRFAYVPQVLVNYVRHDGQQHARIDLDAPPDALLVCDKNPISRARHPLRWLRQRALRRFSRDNLSYFAGKNLLFQKCYRRLLLLWFRASVKRPRNLIDKKWVYLVSRALRRKPELY